MKEDWIYKRGDLYYAKIGFGNATECFNFYIYLIKMLFIFNGCNDIL